MYERLFAQQNREYQESLRIDELKDSELIRKMEEVETKKIEENKRAELEALEELERLEQLKQDNQLHLSPTSLRNARLNFFQEPPTPTPTPTPPTTKKKRRTRTNLLDQSVILGTKLRKRC